MKIIAFASAFFNKLLLKPSAHGECVNIQLCLIFRCNLLREFIHYVLRAMGPREHGGECPSNFCSSFYAQVRYGTNYQGQLDFL
jgi:hypothetical protein